MKREQFSPDLSLPANWTVVAKKHVGPFLTSVTYELPGGRRVEWRSRRHRKGLGLRGVTPSSPTSHPRLSRPSGPNGWMAALFLIGAALFAVGSVPAYAQAVGESVAAATFFVGSLFFTAAALLQFLQAVNAPRTLTDRYLPAPRWLRLFSVEPRRIDWWSTAVQLAGRRCCST